jgi:hypothetical protein
MHDQHSEALAQHGHFFDRASMKDADFFCNKTRVPFMRTLSVPHHRFDGPLPAEDVSLH